MPEGISKEQIQERRRELEDSLAVHADQVVRHRAAIAECVRFLEEVEVENRPKLKAVDDETEAG